MDLHLTDDQAELLIAELDRIIENDRYPLSPRIWMLREIRGGRLPRIQEAASAAHNRSWRNRLRHHGARGPVRSAINRRRSLAPRGRGDTRYRQD
jgi:hypothetical protein